MRLNLRIGISGWRYKPWRGVFYPEDLPQNRELFFASRALSTIEINGTFYSLQRPEAFKNWYRETPRGFVFSVKGARFITHMKRLRNVQKPLANFFASGVLALEEKLGPILWQFPPSMIYRKELFERFFKLLPRDTMQAVKLARKHDSRVSYRTHMHSTKKRKIRHAVEVRHESFLNQEFLSLLEANNIAIVIADTAGKWPLIKKATSDFLYLRLHGDKELYTSGYTDQALRRWRDDIRKLCTRNGIKRVFAYFDNDVKVHAPFDAYRLGHMFGASTKGWSKEGLPVSSLLA